MISKSALALMVAAVVSVGLVGASGYVTVTAMAKEYNSPHGHQVRAKAAAMFKRWLP